MTDVPTRAGLEDALSKNNHVELLSGSTTALNDVLTAVRDIDLIIEDPLERTDHGEIPVFTTAAPDMTLDFTLTLTDDVLAYMRTRSTYDSNGNLPKYKWGFKITPQAGSSRAKTLSFNGILYRRHYMRRDAPNVPSTARFGVRITDNAVPAAS